MRRPPRDPNTPFLTVQQLGSTVIAGTGLLAVILGIFIFNLSQGQPVEVARALALGAFILGNAALAEIERAQTALGKTGRLLRNRLANVILLASVASYGAIVYFPPLATIFAIQPPEPTLWLQPVLLVGLWTALTMIFLATQRSTRR
jgi:Ca2+-transporting ATPase